MRWWKENCRITFSHHPFSPLHFVLWGFPILLLVLFIFGFISLVRGKQSSLAFAAESSLWGGYYDVSPGKNSLGYKYVPQKRINVQTNEIIFVGDGPYELQIRVNIGGRQGVQDKLNRGNIFLIIVGLISVAALIVMVIFAILIGPGKVLPPQVKKDVQVERMEKLSPSDEISDIESDINQTGLEKIDLEISAVEQDLESI